MGDAPVKRYLLDSPGWLVLLVPLLVVLGLALFGDAAARTPDQGDEPTYALQASSLACSLSASIKVCRSYGGLGAPNHP